MNPSLCWVIQNNEKKIPTQIPSPSTVIYFTYFSHANPLHTPCQHRAAGGNNGKYIYEALQFYSAAFIFMFTVGKSYYNSCKRKKKSCLLPEGAYPAWPCRQYCSILSMALEMQCRSMRWEWARLHEKILIKGWKLNHFSAFFTAGGRKIIVGNS